MFFGLRWNFVASRSGRRITSTRAYRPGNVKKSLVMTSSSITCGCIYVIRFRSVDPDKTTISDLVVVTSVTPISLFWYGHHLVITKNVQINFCKKLWYRRLLNLLLTLEL